MTNSYKRVSQQTKTMKTDYNKILILILSAVIVFSLSLSALLAFSPTFATGGTQQSDPWSGFVSSGFAGGTGTEQDPYLIQNGEQLAYLAKLVNENPNYSVGKHFLLLNDIYLNDVSNWSIWSSGFSPKNLWTPIGDFANGTDKVFSGTFDGGDFSIFGLYINSSKDFTGLFGKLTHGVVKNLAIEKSWISGADTIGGIVGAAENSTIFNCKNASTVNGNTNVGGIAGYLVSGSIANSSNSGRVVSSSSTGGESFVGGIAGRVGNSVLTSWIVSEEGTGVGQLEGCFNTGYVFGDGFVGGLVGGLLGANQATLSSVKNSFNKGTVFATTRFSGGIVGYVALGNIENCFNDGPIAGGGRVGGIVGGVTGDASTINTCINFNAVTGGNVEDHTGGIVAWFAEGTALNLANFGSVTSGSRILTGGIAATVGSAWSGISATLYNSVNFGTVNGRANARTGGIAGQVDYFSLVANCFNVGTVNSTSTDLGGIAGRTQNSAFTVLNYYIDNTALAIGENLSAEECTYGKLFANATIAETVGISQIGSLTVSEGTALIDALNAFVSSSLQMYSGGPQFSGWVESKNSNFPMLESLVGLKSELLANAGLTDNSQPEASDTPSLGIGIWGGVNDIATGFAGGDGSKFRPYLISTAAQLNLLRQLVNTTATNAAYSNKNVFYELTNDIFLNDISNYDQWENWVATNNTAELQKLNQWTAIGVESATGYFRANFNGKGFTIFGLFANSASSNIAVFGSCVGAAISNLATEKGFVKGLNSVAGIAALAKEWSIISNCYNTSTVVGTGQNAGGVAGYIGLNTVVKNSYNEGNITGVTDVGGIVGDNTDGAIFNCYNVGNVVGTDQQVGGVSGWVYGDAQVDNCYNTGNVTGGQFVGGVAGNLYSRVAYDSYVKNSYNTGDVSSNKTHIGGVVGYTVASMVVDSYNLGDVSGSVVGAAFVGGVVGRAGEGTVLQSIVKNCYNEGSVFGTGMLEDAGTDYVGGVVGAAYGSASQNAEITNCYNLGTVNSTGSYIGGVAGSFSRSSASKCYNSGEVFGGPKGVNIGGVTGYLSYSTMDSCFNTAKVEANGNNVAGLAGFIAFDSLIFNSYNLGDVVGQGTVQKVGGLAGTLWTNSKIANSYNQGNIFGQRYVGGIVGWSSTQVEVANCYNSGNVVSVTNSSGGIVGTAVGSKINNTFNSGTIFGVNSVGGIAGDLITDSSISNSFNKGTVNSGSNGQGVGGIVGKVSSSSVKDTFNSGNVKASGFYSGGLAGEITASTLVNSGNIGDISSTSDNVGGIVGRLADSSNVLNVFVSGNVAGKTNVGGIAGINVTATVDFAYFLSGKITVSGTWQTTSQEKAVGSGTGKTAKFDESGVIIQNNGILLDDFSIEPNSSTVTEALNAFVGQESTLLSWIESNGKVALKGISDISLCDFLNSWVNANLPFEALQPLSWVVNQATTQPILSLVNISKDSNGVWGGGISGIAWQGEEDIADSFAGGTGTISNPYLISTASQLKLLANLINKVEGTVFNGVELVGTDFDVFNSKDIFYRLTNDILLNELNNYNLWALAVAENDSEKLSTLNPWIPIGNSFENSFKANFLGNGFAVLGVYINTTSEVQGLFGWGAGIFLSGEIGTENATYEGGSIFDLTVDASFVKGKNYVAGIVAYVTDGFVVSGCSNFATVEATNALAGGIVGVALEFSTISANFNLGKISGVDHTGGIAGRIVSSTLIDCQNFGTVTGTNEDVGGIVALMDGALSKVLSCVNFGRILAGKFDTGGIVGQSNNGIVDDCLNAGLIFAESRTGGIVGGATSTKISNSLNIGAISATNNSGGVVGSASTSTLVEKCANSGKIVGSSSQVGGIVGIVYFDSLVLDCVNTGEVFGGTATGGIVGQAGTSGPPSTGYVANCYNLGNVSSNGVFVGGVVGNTVTGAKVFNSYNSGSVSTFNADKSSVGGAVGRLDSAAESSASFVFSIEGTKAIGKIESTSTSIVGSFDANGILTEFGTTNSTGVVTSTSVEISLANAGGTFVVASGKTLVDSLNAWVNADSADTDVKKPALPNGVSPSAWKVEADEVLPKFDSFPPAENATPIKNLGSSGIWKGDTATAFEGGNGTKARPYRIANAAQLALLSSLINSGTTESESKYNNSSVFYILTDNIFLNDTSRVSEWSNWNAEQLKSLNNWIPIGKSSTHTPFKANFDGKNFAVHGLYANGKEYIGLFGAISGEVSSGTAGLESAVYSGGTIKNLTIESGFINGTGYVGGLAGSSMQAYFENCYNNATATVSGIIIGGITGYAEASVLNKCFNSGSIKNATVNIIGGLCGILKNSTVLSSGNSGEIYGVGAHVGGIAGQLSGSVVKYSFNEGDITGNGDNVGGIAGVMNLNTASISNSSNSGTVKGSNYVAGISGYAQDNTTNTFNANSGKIDGNSYVGGIAGLSSSGTTLSSCINAGTIVGSSSNSYAVGGVVGYILGTLANCLNEGDVYGTKTSNAVGGLIGRLGSEARFGSATNIFNIGKVSGGTNVGEILGLQANGALRNVYISETATIPFIGGGYTPTSAGTFNKNGILASVTGTLTNATATVNSTTLQEVLNAWQAANPADSAWVGRPLPTLDFAYVDDYNIGEVWDGAVATTFAGGAGTQSNPFKIATAEQLARLASLVNSGDTTFNKSTTHFELVADIYLNETSDWQNWSENSPVNHWTPIGTEVNSFKANFNGNGFAVYGLYINATLMDQGLFGFVSGELISGEVGTESAKYEGGTVKNLGVLDGLVIADSRNGAISGLVLGGVVSNCHSNVTVKCTGNDIGGLVGKLDNSTVENSFFTGKVSGWGSIGGIVGWAINYSAVANCYNMGWIFGSGGFIGGVVGIPRVFTTVTNCYNLGTVEVAETSNYVGGVVGISGFIDVQSADISNCFNLGTVKAPSSVLNVGSVAGSIDLMGTANNCFYLTGTVVIDGVVQTTAQETAIGNSNGVSKNIGKFDLEGNIIKMEFDASGVDISSQSVTTYSLNDISITNLLTALNAWANQNRDTSSSKTSYKFFDFIDSNVLSIAFSEKVMYKVSFNVNGGSSIGSSLVWENQKATMPANPTKANNIFGGWYADEANSLEFDFSKSITSNTTVFAKWYANPAMPDNYFVIYNANGGEGTPLTIVIPSGGRVTSTPTAPTKAGFNFAGWYSDENLTTQFVFGASGTQITANTYLFAKWENATVSIAEGTTIDGGTYGQYKEYPAIATEGGANGTIVYSVLSNGSLPTGIVLDSQTGVLSGTFLNAGTFSFTIRALVLETNEFADKAFEVVIDKATPVVDLVGLLPEVELTFGDMLPSISQFEVLNDENVVGSFELIWELSDLVAGENQLSWRFVPSDTNNYNEVVGETLTIFVAQKTLLRQELILSLTQSVYTYNGSQHTPLQSVEHRTLGLLVEGVDYTIVYSNNKNVGMATITICGINNFEGEVFEVFLISRANVTVTPIASQTFVYGSTIAGNISYNAIGLVNGESLNGQLGWSGQTSVGQYEVTQNTITNDNNANYNIIFETDVVFSVTSYVIDLEVLLADFGTELTKVFDGTTDFPSELVTQLSAVLLNGLPDSGLTLGVAYSNANVSASIALIFSLSGANAENYSFSGTVYGKITQKSIDEGMFVDLSEIDGADYVYTGSEITPIALADLSELLTLGVDFVANYSADKINVGTVVVTISGIGNYSGVLTYEFTISQATPVVSVPTMSATFGDTLASISKTSWINDVAGSWTWVLADTTLVGNVGTQTFTATFSPTDSLNYKSVTVEVAIEVEQAAPVVGVPIMSAIYGDTLSSISTSSWTNNVAGSWAWVLADTTLVGNVGTQTFTATFTPTDNLNYKSVTVEVTIEVEQATPVVNVPTITAIYGNALSSISTSSWTSDVVGVWAWVLADTTLVGNVGTQTFEAKFTPTDSLNYKSVTVEVAIEVEQATPVVSVPTMTAIYGDTIASISTSSWTSDVAGTWSWVDVPTTLVGNVGAQTFTATFSPTDSLNYKSVTVEVTIEVEQAAPVVNVPTIAAIFGNALSSISTSSWTSDVAGSWSWVDVPTTLVGNVGTQTFEITFSPTDSLNYKSMTVGVTIEVEQATPIVSVSTMSAVYGDTLSCISTISWTSDVAGTWSWVLADTALVGNAGTQTFTATFAPTDSLNYKSVTIEVTIDVSKAILTITPEEKSKIFGSFDPTLTYSIDGLKNGDTAQAVLSGGLSRVAGETVGSYEILQGTLSSKSQNYEIAFVENIKLTINKAPASPIATPLGFKAKFGDTLASLVLPNGWSWAVSDSTSVGEIGTNSFEAIYLPTDLENYDYSQIPGWSALRKRVERFLTVSVERKPLELTMFQSVAAVTFNTFAHTPEILATGLTKGMDFSVAYSNNINAGTALVTVTGIGNFEGTVTLYFAINKMTFAAGSIAHPSLNVAYTSGLKLQNVDLLSGFVWEDENQLIAEGLNSYAAIYNPDSNNYNDFRLNVSVNAVSDTTNLIELQQSMFNTIADLTYTGAALTPTIFADGLTLGTDFSVSYSNNINAGTAVVIVTGRNNYIGTVSLSFKILQAEYTPTAPTAQGQHSFGTLLSAWTLVSPEDQGKGVWTWENGSVIPSVANTGYTAVFSLSSNNFVLVGGSSATVTVAVAESYLIPSMFDSIADVTFSGEAHMPTVSGLGLTQGVDFVVSFSNNVNAGLAVAEVYGIGNFAGIAYLNFVINKASYSDISIQTLSVLWQHGKTLETIALPLGFAWENSSLQIEVGTHSYSAVFNIDSANYNDFTLEILVEAVEEPPLLTELETSMFEQISGNFIFDGEEHQPTVVSSLLTESTDFVVSYSNNLNAGQASVLIQGVGSYTGTVVLTFEIQKAQYVFSQPYATGKFVYGTALGNWTLSEDANGFWSWASPTFVPEVESVGFMAFFTLTNSNFELVEGNDCYVSVEVDKQHYNPLLPLSSVAKTFGASLSAWTLEFSDTVGTWTWEDPTQKPTVENNGYKAVFTLTNSNYILEGSGEAVVAVSVNRALLAAGMFDPIASMTYSGQQLKPSEISGAGIVSGVDFSIVSYGNNVNVLSGGTVVVNGIGNYTGTVVLSFEISRANYSDISHPSLQVLWQSGLTLESIALLPGFSWQNSSQQVEIGSLTYIAVFNSDSQNYHDFILEIVVEAVVVLPEITAEMFDALSEVVYNGLEFTPAIVANNGLVQGIHFAVSYVNNQNAGTASVLIQGIGSYTGAVVLSFEILKAQYTPSVPTTSSNVFGATLSQWQLSGDANGFWQWKSNLVVPTVENSGYIAVFTLTNNNYALSGSDEALVEVTVTPKTLTVSMFNALPSFTYSGFAITPQVTALGLTKNVDFEVAFSNNINAGTAIAKVAGKGNYGGKVELNFVISKKSYGVVAHPTLNVTWLSGMTLRDITLLNGFSWIDLELEILLGNHSYEAIYNIDSQNYNDLLLQIAVNAVEDTSSLVMLTREMFSNIENVTFNGRLQTPAVSAEGLTIGVDFDVFYEDNTNAGIARVLVVGKGNYVGTIELEFTINKAAYSPTVPTSQSKFVFGTQLDSWVLTADPRGAWSWEDGSLLPGVVNSGFVAVFSLNGLYQNNYFVENNKATVVVQVEKATQSSPNNVKVILITMTEIALSVLQNAEYSLDNINWQDSAEFKNLQSGVMYSFFVRFKATDNFLPSNSLSISAKTLAELTIAVQDDLAGVITVDSEIFADYVLGEALPTPIVPAGFKFEGWEDDFGNEINALTEGNRDSISTLIAKWSLLKPTIANITDSENSDGSRTLTVELENANPSIEYSYQWWKKVESQSASTQMFSGEVWEKVVGATESQLTVSVEGEYRCEVTASAGLLVSEASEMSVSTKIRSQQNLNWLWITIGLIAGINATVFLWKFMLKKSQMTSSKKAE